MNNYIWSFEGKCEGVNELNRGLITDYCRFTILSAKKVLSEGTSVCASKRGPKKI